MRKVLGSLSLLVLLLNTLLTPITYAGEYEETVEIIGDNGTEDVVEENEEEEISSEFSVEEEISDDENEEENEEGEEIETEETEDDETITGDVEEEGTGDTEEIETEETVELTGENEELTGEVEAEIGTGTIAEEGTGYAEGTTGDVEELTGGVVDDEIGTGDTEEIVYNKESITGERTYNDVTVKVEALSGIFPEGTELKIEPIKWWNLSNLKDKLVEEQTEVNEDTTVVAFDITFIYSGEEVQPKEGEKVKVTFDYSNNEDLVEADKQENQEVKVYHIEDKDEEGNELKEEEQKIIDVTNKEESEEEGIAVAEGESFSIYAVVTATGTPESVRVTYNLNGGYWTESGSKSPITVIYTKNDSGYYLGNNYFKTPSNTGFMFMGWYDSSNARWTGNISSDIDVYAKWLEFKDLDVYIINSGQSTHYTMMDRNLGATERFNQKYDQQNIGSFGYHFQWGNNYGFKPCYNGTNGKYGCSSFDEGENVSSGELDNTLRSNVSSSKFYYGVWNNNGDMRWSSNNVSDLWGSETDTLEARQGPCPDGYHIPNDSEWEEVINKSKNIGISVVNISVALLLSQPGNRKMNGLWDSYPHTFWSSDASYSTDSKRIKTSFMAFESGNFGYKKEQGLDYGRSIRCFKNVVTNSFDASHIIDNGGLKGEISISSGFVLFLKNPVKHGFIFDGWYTSSGEDNVWGEKIGLGSHISATDYLYAKWSSCSDGYVADDESINCLPESIAYANDQKMSQIVDDLDVFMINDKKQTFHYTLMDRNMGARERYNGNLENQNVDSYGYVYQWGNNYGFPSTGTLLDHGIASSKFQVPYFDWIIHSPSNFSKNVWNTFGTTTVGWMVDADSGSNQLLWQGDGTVESRQGPCPDGYYVPDKTTFESFLNQWKASNLKFNYNLLSSNFLFPIVGYRNKDGVLVPGIGKYWTSTPQETGKGRANTFYLNELSILGGDNYIYSYGYSVRCFKKEANTGPNVFDFSHIQLSGGSSVVLSMLSSGEIVGLTDPVLPNHAFQGWYKDEHFTPGTEVGVGDILLTGDYLYAKWGDCSEGYIKTADGCKRTAEGQKIEQIVEDLDIYILSSDTVKEHYTLMDRNMGATSNNIALESSYGYYYQWGNIYGFDSIVDNSKQLSDTKWSSNQDISAYSWDNPYSGFTFFMGKQNNNGNWMSEKKPNLWGGEESVVSHMQGPCPDEYHVPSTGDRIGLRDLWQSSKSSGRPNSDFGKDLLLPGAGRRARDSSSIADSGKYRYQTSNLVEGAKISERIVYAFIGDSGTLPDVTRGTSQKEWASNGMSMRCFKNVVNDRSSSIDINDIHLNGGTNAIISILSSGEVNSLQLPTRTSSKPCLGLYTGSDFSGVPISVGTILEPGTRLYAKFECNDDKKIWNGSDCVTKVSLSLMDGEELFDFQEIPSGGTGHRPENPESKPGLGFDNWYTLPEGGELFDFDIPITSETIAYAHWVSNEYTITTGSNDKNMGTISVEGEPIHGSRVVFRAVPRDAFHKFIKWELNGNIIKTGDNEYWTGDLVIESLTGSVNVTGYFDDFERCNLPWGGKTGHGSIVTGYLFSSEICPVQCSAVSQTATCNDGNWSVTDFETTYIYSGCTTQPVVVDQTEYPLNNCPVHGICDSMIGYAVNDNMCEQGVYRFKLVKCDEGYHVDNDECVANVYSVNFNANGGEGTMPQDTATYGLNYTFKNSNFTKEGSTFSGWNTKADKSGIRYYSGETMFWSLTGDLTLYAQWVLKTYTVTYDAESHSGTINGQPASGATAAFNTSITLPTSGTSNIESIKEGYQFIGWTTTLNGTTPIAGDTYLVTEDVTFYPIFKKEKVQKEITFHVNYNSGYIYSGDTYTVNKSFSGCTIPEAYNATGQAKSCEANITLPDIIADNNTPKVLGWSTGENERTISYSAGARVTITIPEDKEVHLYAQTKAEGKTYTATYERDSRVEEVKKEPDTCDISETYNGNPQAVECAQAIILPAITAKTGYNTPVWKLGETTYEGFSTIHLSGNVIFTGTATPDQQTLYVVKHYYQRLEGDNIYQLSGTDNLSGATETNLDLSTLQLNPSSIPGFTYRKARVNSGIAETIDITSIQDQDFTNQGEIQPGLVIQLFYTRKNSPVTLHQIEGAMVEKTPQKDSYYYGETITFSGHAESGYTFSGWDIREGENATGRREGNRIDYTMTFTGVNVTPVVRQHKYTIHYNASGAVGTIADRTVNYSEVVHLPTAEKVAEYYTYTGHHFVGWTTGDALITELTKATPVDNGEITLNAKWEENDGVTYSVEHYLEPIAKGRPYEEYELKDTYDGTAPQGTTVTGALNNYPGFEKPAEQGIVLTDDGLVIKYYYTRNSYNYTFNAGEGAKFSSGTTSEVVSFRYQQEVAFPATLIKTGFTQNGWEPVLETAMPAEDKTTTAQWTENHYTIKYHANGGTGTTPSQTVRYTDNIALTGNAFIKKGYAFTGWSTIAQGPVVYKDKDTVHELTGVNNGTVNLYAQWSAEKYVVTFDANSGVVAQATGEVIYDQTYGTLPTPTRDGYEFTGWYTAKVGGTKVESSTEVKTANDHTLYAHWEVNTYKVTLNPTGGEVTPTEITVTYDAQYGDLPIPTAIGYRFAGWYTDTAEPTLVTSTTKVTIASNHMLKAHWYINHYSIEFNANEGVGTMDTITNIAYTGSVKLPANTFAREGYEFKGWSRTPNGAKEFDDEQTVTKLTGDNEVTVILYAVWSINKYTITWKNSTGATLRTDTLPYGATPDYGGTPISGADAQYTYTFAGWEPEIAPITEDQVYTATYNQTINTYTITFKNEDGTELYTTGVAYGTTPVYSGAEPTKENTAQYTYTFNGWSPTLAPVTGEATYTATYTGTINKYTITFVDEDGRELKAGEEYEYGTASGAIVQPDEPAKAPTPQTGYTFAGWTPTLTGVTEDQVYTATYSQTVNSYPITFYDEDGTTIIQGPTQYPYGTLTGVIVPIGTPTKASDGTYTYEFEKWTPELKTVVGTADYRATYKGTYIEYEVTFLDSTGAVLTSRTYHSGETVDEPAGPAKASTDQTGYTFAGWYPEVEVVTGDITYEPTYTETTRTYTIIWNNRDGTELYRDKDVAYGTHLGYTGPVPTKTGDAQYTYTYNGWMPTVHNVTGPQVYTATYSQTTNSYPIIWKNENGTEIKTTQVLYGVTPSYTGPTPTKEGYSFSKWTPDLEPVVGTASYTASYIINSYNITPVKGVGVANILGGGSYPYNTVVTLTGIAKEGYHFEGGVSEKAFTYTVPSHNITPQIDAEPNTYHVHFKPNGGTGVMANQEFTYDVEQELSPNAYTRDGFTFISWTDGEGGYYTDKKKVKNLATTGTVILLAQWFEGDGPTPGPTPTPTPSGGGSSGGGGKRPIDKNTHEHASAAESGDIKEVEDKTQTQTGTTAQTGATKTGTTIQWTEEELTAYQYAYKYGITTLAPEDASMPDAYVIRGHMAKMVVNYALNVLNRKLPAKMPKQCKWKDGRNAWESQEIKEYAEKACALGLMGIDMDYFQPNKLVTRAQFGTIFGRLLWGKIVSKPYYAGHLARLRKRGIMTQIDRPEERIEVRKWAWLMFMRSEKYFKVKK